jgi:lambda family phage tail tape measure protein
MASQNIARLGVVLGLDTAEFTASIDKAISENKKLKDSIRRETAAAEKEIKALKYATDDYGKVVSRVTMVEREMAAGRFKNATADVKKQLLDQAAAYDKIAMSAKSATGAQFKMNEQQKLNLTYQTTDLFTQIASGQSPFIAILQQGGQLKDAMGGIGNMFKAIGTLFTPFSIGLGSVAIAVGSVSYALYKAVDDLDKFKDAMTLTGSFAGVTYDKLLNLGNVLSTKTNASIGDARDVMQQLAATGKYTATSLEAVGEVVLRFAKISGVDAAEAAKTLIPLLDGTASSAKQLNDKYHFLTLEQYKNIEALEKQGKLQEAAKMQATLLNESLQSTQRQLGNLEAAWQGVANFASKAWDAMMGWGREDGVARASELEKKINDIVQQIEDRQSKGLKTGSQEAALKAFRTELNAIVNKEIAALDAVEAKMKKAEQEQQKIKDYAGAGGAGKSLELSSAIAKAEAEVRFLQAMKSANEIEKIELEAQKKIDEKKAEFSKKSAEEKRAFGGMLAKQEAAEILAIELDKQQKIQKIRSQEKINIAKATTAEEESLREFNNEYAKMVANAEWATREKTRSMELGKEDLELKYQLIYATEKEVKLAELALKYERMREEAKGKAGESTILENLDKQEKIERFFVETQDSMKRTQQVFDSVWGNLGSAIDNFVKTGKLNMKDFARSVIQDLIAIQMKAAAMKFLGAMFGMSNPMTMTQTDFVSASGGRMFADGGDPPVGMASLVGERGPELFVPRTAGTIIPNHDLGKMGGTTTVINNNINAIDAKSFENRLLESSNTIWAGYQYANKQLASNGRRA